MNTKITELYFARNQQAIDETKREYGKLLSGIVSGILPQEQDVEECLNDTYLQLWNTIPPTHPESIRAYACKIARNLALNKLKYITAMKRGSQFDVVLDELSEVIPADTDVQSQVDSRELGRLISKFLRQQPSDNRIIFIKRYWQFMPSNEIAKDLGYSRTKVNSSLHRTRARLRQFLNERGYNA